MTTSLFGKCPDFLYNNSIPKTISAVSATTFPNCGIWIQFGYHGDETSIVTTWHSLEFPLNKNRWTLEELHFDSYFVRGTKRSSLLYRKFFGMATRVFTTKRVFIGSVSNDPRAGSCSVISANLPMYEKFFGLTRCVRKSEVDNVTINGTPRSFSFMDSGGYIFNPTSERDKYLLERYIDGLPQGYTISKQDDSSNGLTHVLLACNARSLWVTKPTRWISWSKYLSSWFKTPPTYTDPEPDTEILHANTRQFGDLYNLVVKMFAKRRCNNDIQEARARVFVVVTHLDTILHNDYQRIRTVLSEGLARYNIPKNSITFVQKECHWKPEKILDQDKTTRKFFEEVS
jgi:hypothetical protein